MPRRTTSHRERGQCPPEHGQRLRPGQRAGQGHQARKKRPTPLPFNHDASHACPISIQKTPTKKPNTCRAPLGLPREGRKKNKSKKIDGTPAIDKSIPRANQTETKPGRATGPKLSHNNKKLFIVSRPSIHPSMQPGKEKHPPLTAHPAQNLPSIPHSTTWPRSCSSAASAASGHTTPPS